MVVHERRLLEMGYPRPHPMLGRSTALWIDFMPCKIMMMMASLFFKTRDAALEHALR